MTAAPSARPLLTVKHTVPPARPLAVHRARLTGLLDDGDTRLVTVVAPAGWGKTSLLGAWAGGRDDVSWVSLDQSDDDPGRFWSYVLAALGGAVGPEPLAALRNAGYDQALPLLVNALAAVRDRHVLVLDDYHVLADPVIHEGVEFLVTYLPPTVRLVLASRVDPPLPLARMRARGELTELRASDLRFTPGEATALVTGVAGARPDDAVAATVWGRTEGWAAGLHLAGLALRAGDAPPGRGGDHVLDYFTSEVLPTLAPEQRALLVGTAPLELLSGPLCDRVLQVEGSDAVLAALDRAELFVVALDERREWYRCHHLLREALLRESLADAPGVLHRAAEWFLAEGRRVDAVRHLLAAGDGRAAADVLDTWEQWFLDRGAAAEFLRLGEALEPETVGPGLALALAYGASTGGRPERVGHWLDVCDAGITEDTVFAGWRSARAAAQASRALFHVPDSAADESVALAREAVDLEGPDGNPIALIGLGTTLVRAGRFDDAAPILRDLWARRDDAGWPRTITLQVSGVVGLCLLELGRTDELDRLLEEATPLVDAAESAWAPPSPQGAGPSPEGAGPSPQGAGPSPRGAGPALQVLGAAAPLVALLRIVQGRRQYGLGDRERALATLRHATTLSGAVARPGTRVLALVALADAELACGDRAAARDALARAREIADDEAPAPFVSARLDEAETRIGRRAVRAAVRGGELFEELTDRELSVLRALTGTASRRDIGAALNLSVNTVKAYTAGLYRKLDVSSRQDAVAVGRRLGLI